MNKCKNCDSNLIGLYCNQCGQKNVDLLTIKELFAEFFDNILSLDSKLFISLKYLITKPGFLTLEYWSGKRNKYVSPFRLYLVLSVFYFFISSIVSSGLLITTEENDPIPDNYYGTLWIELDEYPNPASLLETLENNIGIHVNKGIKIAYERRMTVESIMYSSMSTALFLLMPFMAVLLLKVLYRDNSYLYSHHLITTLHLHSFLFLILIINSIISYLLFAGMALLYAPFIIIFIYYIYSIIMFRRAYQNSKFITFFKSSLLNTIYGLFVIASMLVIMVGKIFLIGYYS